MVCGAVSRELDVEMSREFNVEECFFWCSVQSLMLKCGSVVQCPESLMLKCGSVLQCPESLMLKCGSVVQCPESLMLKCGSVVLCPEFDVEV